MQQAVRRILNIAARSPIPKREVVGWRPRRGHPNIATNLSWWDWSEGKLFPRSFTIEVESSKESSNDDFVVNASKRSTHWSAASMVMNRASSGEQMSKR